MSTAAKQEDVFIGISFGSLNSSVAIVNSKDKGGETIANEDGDRIIPSYVAYNGYDTLCGTQAKAQAMSNPKGTIVQFRNLLGLPTEVDHQLSSLSMSIVEDSAHQPAYEIEEYESEDAEDPTTKQLSVSAVTTAYLASLKETAQAFLGKSVNGVVVSVPTHFAEKSKAALIQTAKDAGFAKVFTIAEPIAAVLAFDHAATINGLGSTKPDRLVLVVDLGGHQLNTTLVSANNGLYSIASSLDDYKIGGSQFDEVLVSYVKEEFKRKTKLDVGNNRRALAKARNACEQTKRMLSQKDTAPCSIDSFFEGLDFHGQVIRGRFEHLAEPLFERIQEVIERALKEGSVTPEAVDEVLLVGGSTRIPALQSLIGDIFPETTVIRTDVEPDEAIGNGAAKQGGIIAEVEAEGVSYAEASVNKEVVELPHLAHSVGLEAANGSFVKIIPRLAPIPARRAVEFSNSVQGQTEVFLAVYEGEDEIAKNNHLLAEIVVNDLPEGLNVGEAKIDVTFLIEKDEVLQVVAKERSVGKQLKVKVTQAKH
ncbi:70-kilodalton heat shock protein [Physocladia obscura]|uniref:70-kilodalton heat shock protein n=1 Tax=Physocladia obscura TaxID=109957 RepID=A0AAD5T2Q2_9FUNG|nr:70-kilodalton heat shock protein [Physocladia obscura]